MPVPRKNAAYRVTFPIFDADGDLVTGATGLDSEISKDGGTFADCTNEATEIATASGIYYLDCTSSEMNADTVAIIVKTSTSGAKTTPIVLYPQETGDIRVDVDSIYQTALSSNGPFQHLGIMDIGTAQSVTGTTIRLRAGFSATNDVPIGATVWIYSSTNGLHERRIVTDYDNSTKDCTVDAWTQTPTGTILYALIATPPSATGTVFSANVVQISGDAAAADNLETMLDGTGGGTLTATVNGSVASVVGAVGSVSGAVGSVTGAVGSVTGAVGSVAGNVAGNVVGSVASVSGAVGSVTAAVTVGTINSGPVDTIWDEVVDGATTARQSVRLANAMLGGKASGLATTTAVYRDLADTKDRVSASVDASGNRSALTRDLT